VITQLDNQAWSKELVTGNAQFIEVGSSVSPPIAGTFYVVSQVRADNTFAVFKSQAAPPAPGPGYAFDITATYTFPIINGKHNTSFDPCITYDANSQRLYILGTQDNTDGKDIDVVLFAYSTATDTFVGEPITLTTASYIRDSFDICTLGDNQFVAVAVTNPAVIWQTPCVSEVTSISISGSIITVTAQNSYLVGQHITFSALQNATFLNGVSVRITGSTGSTFSATFLASPPSDYTQVGYESGFATRLPGHSLLGFELDMAALEASPPADPLVSVTTLDTSPFRSGDCFGAVSVYSPDGLNIEVYYEAHPKLITYADQFFNLNLAYYSVSPPSWNTTTLKTFSGRYADNRLTVIPSGTTRTLLQQYYSQLVHQNALVGNLLLGYYNGSTWSFHITPGSATNSYIQGTLSVTTAEQSPPVSGAYVSYIAEPTYNIRGGWSPEVRMYAVADRVSFDGTDYIVNTAVAYAYKGAWTNLAAYPANAVVKVALPTLPVSYGYYTAKNAISVSLTSPNLDTTNWIPTPTPDVDTSFTEAPTSWPLKTNSLDVSTFNLSDVPGFYNNLNFTWLRGSKTVMDSGSRWGVVGEQVGSTTSGATFITDFDVPPVARLSPTGTVPLLRGVPLLLSAAGTNDGDNDAVRFVWTYSPHNSNVTLTPDTSTGATATMLVNRAIGGATASFTVGVVAVDYEGNTPLHPPMNVTGIDITNNVLTVETDSIVNLSVGEQVFLYNLTTATFLNDQVVTVTGIPLTSSPPSGTAFTASFTHADYSLSDTGKAIANAQFAFCQVVIPTNATPTIDFTHDAITHASVSLPIQAARNTLVTINPTLTGNHDADDLTAYAWTQTSGTTIPPAQIVSGSHTASLQFDTNGVLLQGEAIVWMLTVNDAVNPAVTSTVTVDVASFPFNNVQDTLRLSRSIRVGNIAQRHMLPTFSPPMPIWSPLDVSVIYTNFQSIKRNSVLDGTDRYLLISPASVCVYGGINPNVFLLRKLFVPGNFPIVDAVHSENDWTLVLDNTSKLYRYSTAPLINTDNPDTTIDLTKLSSMTFNKLFTTFSFGNVRVIILTGPDGSLLLQLRNTDLQIQGALELTVNAGLLYGIDNVQFVRTSNVESLHKGKILYGTLAPVVANITNVAVADNSVTILAANTLTPGEMVTFANLTQATFLNGVKAAVVTASATQFVISYLHTDYAAMAEPAGATATTGGKTYETLIDLSHGQIIGTWDASKLKNQFVSTGEILFEPNDTYAGVPSAPVMANAVNKGLTTGRVGFVNMLLSWTADRPDLITSYNLELSFDNVNWNITAINSGYIESVTLPQPIGQMFYARVKAFSLDGVSPYSNVVTFHT
jgi:hypothetical protein